MSHRNAGGDLTKRLFDPFVPPGLWCASVLGGPEFSEDSYELPSLPGRYFKLFITTDTMTVDKESLFNYGHDLETFLDNSFHKPAALRRTIEPNDSNGFYIRLIQHYDGIFRILKMSCLNHVSLLLSCLLILKVIRL
jgi:hypothetical protein